MLGQGPTERPSNNPPNQQPQQQPSRFSSNPPPNRAPQTPIQGQPRPQPINASTGAVPSRPQLGGSERTTPNQLGNPRPPPNAPASGSIPDNVGFFSARAVNQLPESSIQDASNVRLAVPQGQQAFNPKAESPSIRKTPGIDHSSSKPLARNGQHVPPTSSQAQAAQHSNTSNFTPVRPPMPSSQSRGNVINPSLDHTRRIGAPGGPGSPLANRGSYRPPTMKRPPPGDVGNGRPPLADLPANDNAPVTANGVEAKRQKMA